MPELDQLEINNTYIDRLAELLRLRVRAGVLSVENFEQILKSYEDQYAPEFVPGGYTMPWGSKVRFWGQDPLREPIATEIQPIPKDAPYYSEIFEGGTGMPKSNLDWHDFSIKETQKVNALNTQKETQAKSYLPGLKTLLDASVSKGDLSPNQAMQQWQNESDLINQGMKASQLPNYENVKNWIRAVETGGAPKGELNSYQKAKQELFGTGTSEGIERWKYAQMQDWWENVRPEQQAEKAERKSQAQASAAGVMGGLNRVIKPSDDQRRATFERARQTELAKYQGPYNWIQRFMWEHASNPQDRDYQRTVQLPATPGFLSGLVPDLATGQPVKPAETPIPSAQQWSRLSAGEQQMYAGYLGWQGKSIEDVTKSMESMILRTPYGAGRPRWSVPRQKVGR